MWEARKPKKQYRKPLCLRLFHFCSTRYLLTWGTLSTLGSLILGLVLFFSLLHSDPLENEVVDASVIPNTNIPYNYSLFLSFRTGPEVADGRWDGRVNISFRVVASTRLVLVHRGKNVEIVNATLYTVNFTRIQLRTNTYNEEAEIQSFRVAENLTLNSMYFLVVSFKGSVLNGKGPQVITLQSNSSEPSKFVLSYVNTDRATKGLRYVMPCFDADNFPASFQVTIEHKRSISALSNGISSRERPGSDESTVMADYKPTLVLRPSQNAFVLCSMTSKSVERNDINVSLRVSRLKVDTRRLMQFMDQTDALTKLDAVILPNVTSAYQPGIAVLNEQETIAENQELSVDSLID